MGKTGAKYDFTLSPQQIASCTPDSGAYGCLGCNGGFTEGAYEYVKSAPGLANGFYIPYEQSLARTENTKACPTAKVDAITGETMQLSGSYAQVSGYSYATPPCTSGSCESQNLKQLAAALETTPLSVCVNAGVWNDCTGGLADDATIPDVKVDLSQEEVKEAEQKREAMYQLATSGGSQVQKTLVV